jgi:hypothetical protein
VVGVVVLVAAGVTIAAISMSGSGAGARPGETVQGYLEALARGDAEGALAYAADTPADKTFLTDEVLDEQIGEWPITDIRILSEDGIGNFGTVHVAVKFGEQVSDVTMTLDRVEDGWKLKAGAIKIEFPPSMRDDAAAKTVTLFGTAIDAGRPVYVFPGWLDIGNTNPNLTQTSRQRPLLLDQLSGYQTSAWLSLDYSVSDSGRAAIRNAVKSTLERCATSRSLAPPNCPQRMRTTGLVDGTAAWTWSQNLDDLSISEYLTPELTVRVNGTTSYRVTADGTDGPTSGEVNVYLSGEADLTQDPPAVTLRG